VFFPDVSRHQNSIIFKAWKIILLGVCEPWKWDHESVSKIQKERHTVTQYVCVCVCHAQIHNGLMYVTFTTNLDSCQGWLVILTLWRICCQRKFLFWPSERRLGDTQRESNFGGKRKNLSLCRGYTFDRPTSNQFPSMLLRPIYTQFTYRKPAVQLETAPVLRYTAHIIVGEDAYVTRRKKCQKLGMIYARCGTSQKNTHLPHKL